MEQERDGRVGGGERDMNKQQDHDFRLKDMQQGGGGGGGGQPIHVQPQQRQQQSHQCPRCGSHNTKFCYYNNHSLAQPRYLCKSCRRNWTQGGTLRNVPVGGSSRKRKRVENSSSSQSPQPQPPPPPSQGVVVQTQYPNLTMVKAKDPSPAMAHSIGPFYQGGGMYLSSMVEIPSLNQSQPHLFYHSLKVGSDGYGSSNFGFGYGLNNVGREREEWSPYIPQQGSIIPSHNMTNSNNNVASHSCWPQSLFINNANNMMTYDDSSLGSTINCSTTSISGNTEKRL